jgi:long-chain acyl-CoA synthetase
VSTPPPNTKRGEEWGYEANGGIGGETIYPLEVESRLVAHPSGLIARAAVVGIAHPKYGEVVGAFLLPSSSSSSSSPSTAATSSTSSTAAAASAITPSPPSPSSPTTATSPEATTRPSDDDLRTWVRAVLGRHKAPAHIFWFGDAEVGMSEVPQTGSGKVKKHVLREVGGRIVAARG